MNFTLLSVYVSSVLVLLLTPGPVVALITHSSVKYGSRKAFATALGTNFASLCLISLAILMLLGIVSLPDFYLNVFGVLGSVYLGWMAASGLVDLYRRNHIDSTFSNEMPGFKKGFLIGISNPKDILFFIAFFPQFISISQTFFVSIMTLCFIWIILDLTILSIYIYIFKQSFMKKFSRATECISLTFLLIIALISTAYNVIEMLT
ncbi:LysE family translocator [Shewanella sp. YIC-542]|uniref:LysE family translocator n=1 Tax=Shewanella mytili TaxID=3377111 RepID=UPI00398E4FFD